MPDGQDGAIRETERWFVSRGLPHFVYKFRSSRDVWVAVVPIVLLLFVIEIAVLAPNEEYPVLGSIAAVVAGVAVLVALWAVTNRLRGRAWLARPNRIGPIEVLLFVLGPALIPLAFGGQWRSAVTTAGINLVVLGLAYFERRYAVVSLARWTLEHFASRLRTVSGVLLRALPLLLIVVVLVFFTTETWQLAHELRWPVLLLGAGLFIGLGLVFAVMRAPDQIGEVESDVDWTTTRELVAETPAAVLATGRSRTSTPPPLSRSERRNVRMVVVVSEATLVAIVSVALFLFFIVLGLVTVPPTLATDWIGRPPDVLFTFDLFGQRMGMTTELIKVAGFVASFAALQFTVSLLSDRAYEDEFLSGLRADLRQAFAVRAVYLRAVLPGTS
ncbi:MAG: hypothetical protein WEC34_13385 [Acidimicrobiia bacterium]